MRIATQPLSDSVKELEIELAQVDLSEKRREDILRIRQTFALNFDTVELKDIGPVLMSRCQWADCKYAATNVVYRELTEEEKDDSTRRYEQGVVWDRSLR